MKPKDCQSCRWFDLELIDLCQLNMVYTASCKANDFYRWEPPIRDDRDDKALDREIEREG